MGSGAAMYSLLNNSAWGLNTTSYVDSQYTKDTITAVFFIIFFCAFVFWSLMSSPF